MSNEHYELDIAAFVRELLSRWRLFAGLLVLGLILNVAYFIIMAPVYRAEAFVGPPTATQIRDLERARTAAGKVNQNDIFHKFKRNVMSRHVQEQFLQTVLASPTESKSVLEFIATSADGFSRRTRDYLMMETRWRVFREKETEDSTRGRRFSLDQEEIVIRVNADKTASRQQLLVTLDWQNKGQVQELLDRLISYMDRHTAIELVREVKAQIQSRISNINELIEYKKKLYTNQKKRQLAALEEALRIAEDIGAIKPIDALSRNVIVEIAPPANLYRKPEETEKQPVHFIDTTTYLPLYQISAIVGSENNHISSQPPPLYTRGAEALRAEISALKSRTNHELFIQNLGRFEEELSWLRDLDVSADQTETITYLTPARLHKNPVSPGPWIVFGSTVGIALVVFLIAVSVLIFLGRGRRELASNS